MVLNYRGNDRQDGRLVMHNVLGTWRPELKEVSQDEILAAQEVNRKKRIASNARIWTKQKELGRKGK